MKYILSREEYEELVSRAENEEYYRNDAEDLKGILLHVLEKTNNLTKEYEWPKEIRSDYNSFSLYRFIELSKSTSNNDLF